MAPATIPGLSRLLGLGRDILAYLKPWAAEWWAYHGLATNGSTRVGLRGEILRWRYQRHNGHANRSRRQGIPVCGISSRRSTDRDDWRTCHRAPPTAPIPRRESCVERQHIGRRMTNLQDSVKRGMDTRMPRGEGLNLPGRAVNQIESLAPNIRRPLYLPLASHDQHGKPVKGQQKIFNLCQFQI